MPTNNSFINMISIMVAALLLASCAAPIVKQNILMPANSLGLQKAKKIAIINFSGDRNEEFSNKISSFFTSVKVKNKPYFTIVDQNMRNSIIEERKIQIENGALIGDEAVQFGKISGADTLISGFVKWPTFTNTAYAEKRTKCLVRSKVKQKALGISYYPCIKEKKFTVSCNKRSGSFNFTLKAVSVLTGDLIHTKTYTTGAEDKHCSDSSTAQIAPSSMEQTMVSKAIARMRRDVAPYMQVVSIQLMDDDDSELSKNKHAEKLFENGLEFAKNNRMQRACKFFEQASQSYQHSPAIFHNLGVCAEMTNKFAVAASMYQKADGLLEKPEKLIDTALVRVDERMRKDKLVKSQLR